MKQRFRLFRRGPVFHLEDSEIGHKESLRTRAPREAERLRHARNETADRPQLGLTLGRAYLAAYDPKLPERRWGGAGLTGGVKSNGVSRQTRQRQGRTRAGG